MKKKLFLLSLLMLTSMIGFSQTTYPETVPITSYGTTGMFYQYWSTGSSLDWSYLYSTKITVNHSEARNFEITTLDKEGQGLAFRQWSQNTNAWTPWKKVLTDDGAGVLKPLHIRHSISGYTPDNVTGLFVESSGSSAGHYVFQTASAGGGKSFSVTNAGYVGIGNPTPATNLDVSGTTMLRNAGDGAVLLKLQSERGWSFQQKGTGSGAHLELHNYHGNNKHFLISTDGNVGIGLGNALPDEKLTVRGTVHSREVRVDLDPEVAPDYVFEKDYNLLPLTELESYITQHKHLPEVPSAKEMEADGLNLKEMNLILLKKVEELTLHLIEKEKALKAQQSKLEVMDDKFKDLQSQIEALKKSN